MPGELFMELQLVACSDSNQFPGMSLNASTVSDAGTSIPSFPDLHCFQIHEERGGHGIFFNVRDVKVV